MKEPSGIWTPQDPSVLLATDTSSLSGGLSIWGPGENNQDLYAQKLRRLQEECNPTSILTSSISGQLTAQSAIMMDFRVWGKIEM